VRTHSDFRLANERKGKRKTYHGGIEAGIARIAKIVGIGDLAIINRGSESHDVGNLSVKLI
jgi:hypothetical protein